MSRMCYYCMNTTKDEEFCNFCGKQVRDVPSHHLMPGSELNGKYTVGYSLGEGGFGITYIGLDTSLQIKIAIKEFFPRGIVGRNNQVSADVFCVNGDNTESLFLTEKSKVINEARILAKFSNEPGIVNVRDYFEANNTAYIVMEYLEGETLESYLEHTGPLSPDETFDLLYPVMKVVEKLHSENVVHRDISPDNLMFSGKQLKLLDFGAAREVLYSTSKSFSVILKHGYAPEEQYRRKGYQGPWTDIYALCATMYFCMTGVVPDTSLDRLHEDELKPLSSYGVVLTDNQESAMNKGLSVLLENRFKKISEFIDLWNGNTVSVASGNVKTNAYKDNKTVFAGDADYTSVDDDNRNVKDFLIAEPQKAASKKRKRIIIPVAMSFVAVAAIGFALFYFINNNQLSDNINTSSSELNEQTTVDNVSSIVAIESEEPTSSEEQTSEVIVDYYQSYLDEADALVIEEKYDEAIETLEESQQLYGEDGRVEQKIHEISKMKCVVQLDVLINDNDYINAIVFIDQDMLDFNKDEDIKDKREECVVEYRKIVISQADKELNESGYESAIDTINEAIKVIGNDDELQQKIEEYEEYKPVSLKDLTVTYGDSIYGNSYSFSSSEKDPRDEINEGVMLLVDGTVEFYIGQEYSTLKGKIDPTNYFERSALADTRLNIYADDKLVYSSPVITYKTDDLEFSADIKGADYLKFDLENVSGFDAFPEDIMFYDTFVVK